MRRRRLLSSGFNPSNIFRDGASGGIYNPFLLQNLFKDFNGITSVSASNDSVGLLLDESQSQQLGNELISNGDFSNGTTNWTLVGSGATQSATSGQLVLTRGSSTTYSHQAITTVVGTTYKLLLDVVQFTSNPVVRVGTAAGGTQNADISFTSTGAKQIIFTATATTTYISLYTTGTSPNTTTYDNVGVKSLAGNHASQSNSSFVPIYVVSGTQNWIDFDGVNDFLSTASGGGSTTGFLFCAAVRPTGRNLANRTLCSDTGSNTGYRVRINSSNKLELAAGNGTAYTTVQSNETLSLDTTYVVTAWHDGTYLYVQVNTASSASTAFSTASAGTSAITFAKDNGASSNYFDGNIHYAVYVKNSLISDSDRIKLINYVASKSEVSI